MFHSRLIGVLFLAGFAAYGTGFALVTSVISAPDFLANIAVHRSTLVLGALLMLLTIVTDVWRAVVFFPIVGERGRSTALTYLAAQIVSVSMFFVGALSLLLLVPLGQFVGGAETGWATALGTLLVQFNENAYALSQLALVFGSLSLWVFGLRVGLIPRAFAGYAVVGYAIHLGGTVAELFGYPVSDMLLIPGALFEVALPIWLFIKGFDAEAYGKAA
ncbi:hypothetical protein VW23_021255 [Devosia insulae DS-56]|uniref:DUF4386 domain-containing protein n=2 Tax=Devosia insulae TaxID=408174 RepID=A0A1E5XP94_9HYPH|nr:hypothetical protein VW23_021255 [Devosia insulae DS-56]